MPHLRAIRRFRQRQGKEQACRTVQQLEEKLVASLIEMGDALAFGQVESLDMGPPFIIGLAEKPALVGLAAGSDQLIVEP